MRKIFRKISVYIPSPGGRVRVGVLFLLLPFSFYAQTNTFPDSGNVGIGTTNPASKLHVNGDLYLFGNDNYENGWKKTYFHWRGHSLIMGSKEGTYAHNRIELKPGGSSRGELFSTLELYQAINTGQHDKRIVLTSLNSQPTYFNAGNVGIGTSDPGTWKLAVNGNIRAKEIKVETGWSDFVFEENYTLPTLEEVEQHIQEKGHLKDIPSAKEVAQNGIFLGEMDAKLLQKIEELTLYIIAQDKQIKKLNEENARVKVLEDKLNKLLNRQQAKY